MANLWWPGIHRQVVEKADKCDACRKYGKNLKSLIPKAGHAEVVEPTYPNEEVQLDFAGPLYPDSKTKTYLLVAIDRYTRFPSVLAPQTLKFI